MLLLLLLASCTPGTPSTPATSTTLTPSGVRNSVTLLLWHAWYGTGRYTLAKLADQFNQEHPQERISLQAVPISSFNNDLWATAAAGGGPHIVLIPNTWVGGLADAQLLLPLDDLIPKQARADLIPATLQGASIADQTGTQRLYGLPISFDTLVLYYNAANILTPPADTNALIENARGLSEPNGNPPRWGLGINLSLDNTIGYLYAFGGQVFDDQGNVVLGSSGRNGAEQWLNWLRKLHDDQRLFARTNSSISVDRELKNGHLLMAFDWAHQLGVYRNLWGKDLGLAVLPRLSDTNELPQPYVRSDILAINRRVNAAERQVALEFLRFMTSEKAQQLLLEADLQPTRSTLQLDARDGQHAAAQVFRSQASYGRPMLNSSQREAIWDVLRFMQQRVLLGLASSSDAVTEADKRLRERFPETKPR